MAYLGNILDEPEIWIYCGKENIPITKTDGQVRSFNISSNGYWIFYLQGNENGETSIRRINRNGKRDEHLYSCGENDCDNLAISPDEGSIAFTISGNEPGLALLQIGENYPKMIEHGIISSVDFSPNGSYLRYYVNDKRLIFIMAIKERSLVQTLEGESDLIGSWNLESTGFLYGTRAFEGGIPDLEFYEYDLLDSTSKRIFEQLDESIKVSKPTYFVENNFLVQARTGFRNNTKQLWIISKDANEIIEITSDHQYDHSGYSWSAALEKLAFQRYLISDSKALPEVWIWDKNGGNFQLVASEAAHPIWLP